MPTTPATTAALLLSALIAAAAHAQPTDQPSDTRNQPDPDAPPAEITNTRKAPAHSVTLSGSFADSADFDSDAGDLQIARLSAALDVTFDLGPRRSLTLGLVSERSWYDFSGATTLHASGDPFGAVTGSELFLRYTAPFNDTTGYFALASVGIAAEDGADISDSFVYTGGLGFTVKASDTFSWGLGVLVRTQLEDDALVIPLPQVRWAISDKWTLESRRAGLRLGYAHSDALSYGLQGEYNSRSFRLKDDGPIPDGMATDRRVPVSFFADYKPADNITIGASVGASLYSNIELIDSAGNDIADDDLDPAVFFALTARIAF